MKIHAKNRVRATDQFAQAAITEIWVSRDPAMETNFEYIRAHP